MAETERTEPATPHRRREARERGQVAKSPEINTAFVLLVGFLTLRYLSAYIFKGLESLMKTSFLNLHTIELSSANVLFYGYRVILWFMFIVLPFTLIILIAAAVANLLQVGFLHSWQVIRPQLTRINPITGIKRFFSYRIIIELFKSSLKILLVGWIAYLVIRSEFISLILTADKSPLENVRVFSSLVFRIGLRIGLALLVLALIDYFYQRWEYEKSLRMSREELKEELIRHEGRPEVRQRIRFLQRRFALRRMMLEVPKAEVVVTNPTRLAIALQYNPKEMTAPKVIAKGARLIAERIIEIARKYNVPVVENKALAQTLFKQVEVGRFIPLALYQVVAEVLAYLWRIGKAKKEWFRER